MRIPEMAGSALRKLMLLLCLSGGVLCVANAQTNRLRFARTTLPVGTAMAEIEKQTGLLFAINHAHFDTSRSVSFDQPEGTLKEFLDRLVEGTPLTYVISGHHILILIDRSEPEEVKASTPFFTIRGERYNNPDFENDIREYNERVAEERRNSPKGTVDSVRMVPVLVYDSVYRYPSVSVSFRPGGIGFAPSAWESSLYRLESPSKMALKINLLYGAASLTPNLGLEIGLGKRTSLDLSGSYNPWNRKGSRDDNRKLVHWIVRPEFRWWTCERFNGHFFGIHPFYWQYNISGKEVPLLFEKEFRYDGKAYGGGISWGYHLPLGRNWGVEFNAGVGVAFLDHKKYDCLKCSRNPENVSKTWFGPTSLGIKLVYVIK